jgi:catechol 2,3-dioxygenase-like lactoylglutathione lyase family enzyme
MIESLSAVALAIHDMRRAVRFYRFLGFQPVHGGEDAEFTSLRAGPNFVNLTAQPGDRQWTWWGRVIFYESDVDGLYRRLVAAGYRPDSAPRDAEWGERFFHLTDPDGHELSFAWPLGKDCMIAGESNLDLAPTGRRTSECELETLTLLDPAGAPSDA